MKNLFNLNLLLLLVSFFYACENNQNQVTTDIDTVVTKEDTVDTPTPTTSFVPTETYVYTGYIEKSFFTMKLNFKETKVTGYYFYKDRKKQIFLEGTFSDDNLKLVEVGDDNPEFFEGKGVLDKSAFSGNWQKNKTTPVLNFSFKTPPKDEDADNTNELQKLIAFYKKSAKDAFPTELAEWFISDALEGEYSFAYNENYIYTKGKIEYENENFIAFSFNKEGDTGYHMLDADFIFTVNKKTGAFINSAFVGSNTDYEWHSQRGYNKSENIKYSIEPSKNNQLAFKIICIENSSFYNFNTEMEDYKEENITEDDRSKKGEFYFEVDIYGRFSDRFDS